MTNRPMEQTSPLTDPRTSQRQSWNDLVERIVFLIEGAVSFGYPYEKICIYWFHLTLDLNVKCKENVRKQRRASLWSWGRQRFLIGYRKGLTIKKKRKIKLDYIRIKNFYSSKDTIKTVKGHPIKGGKMSAIYLTKHSYW